MPLIVTALLPSLLAVQTTATPGNTTSVPLIDPAAERGHPPEAGIFGIIPNARSAAAPAHYVPLSPYEKFKIAASDSFDRGTIVLGAIFGAQGFLSTSNPSFGHGLRGYAKYFGTGYGDFLIGNMMTEGVFPVLLRQDPRYFRAGSGKKVARVRSSIKQIFWTTTDSGRHQFNFSEVGGNAAVRRYLQRVLSRQSYCSRLRNQAGKPDFSGYNGKCIERILTQYYPLDEKDSKKRLSK